MTKLILIAALSAVLLTSCLHQRRMPTERTDAMTMDDAPAELARISPGTPTPLRKHVFRTGTMFSFKGIKPETPDFLDLVQQLPRSALRMPCGTGMNFWDWNSGQPYPPERFEAMGFDMSHFTFKWLFAEARKIHEETGAPTPERLMKFSKTTGHDPLIGINVTTATPEENLEFLVRLRKTGVRPLGFELGNEM